MHIINNFVATGRAKCQCCGKKIDKGLTCVKVVAFRSGGQCHKSCDPVQNFLEVHNEQSKSR